MIWKSKRMLSLLCVHCITALCLTNTFFKKLCWASACQVCWRQTEGERWRTGGWKRKKQTVRSRSSLSVGTTIETTESQTDSVFHVKLSQTVSHLVSLSVTDVSPSVSLSSVLLMSFFVFIKNNSPRWIQSHSVVISVCVCVWKLSTYHNTTKAMVEISSSSSSSFSSSRDHTREFPLKFKWRDTRR